VSRSGYLSYNGEDSGWLEVAVRTSGDPTVTVFATGRDTTRPSTGEDEGWCHFTSSTEQAWTGGASTGYQRLERIGPDTRFFLTFSAPTAGVTFDARVVNDAGKLVGDLTHEVPDPEVDDTSFELCYSG
jgi:hypothetical protein